MSEELGSRDLRRALRESAVVLACLLLAALAVQTSALLRVPFGSAKPDLLLGVLYYFARYLGAVPGCLLGFLIGLLEDASNPETLGMGALSKASIGYLTGRFWAERRLFKHNWRAEVVTLAAALVLHDLLYLLFYTAGRPGDFVLLLGRVTLPAALYTALFCPAAVGLYRWVLEVGPKLHARLLRLQ